MLFNVIIFYGGLSILIFPDNVHSQSQNEAKVNVTALFSGLKEVIGTPVAANGVRFFLHSSEHHNRTIDPFQPYEMTSNFKTFFLIHGWTQSRDTTPWFKPMTDFLLADDPDTYVVQIDWSRPAAANYSLSVFYTESVGNIIGDFIHRIVKQNVIAVENIVLIGHSLGAHVSGFAGKRYYALTHKRLPRIIGLDPAGPLFSKRTKKKRLNRRDARVVMVVHTNGGVFGIAERCGTIDFFPNGGRHQPGCARDASKELTSLLDPGLWCDHRKAYDLFLKALKYPQFFMATKCRNYKAFKDLKCRRTQVSLGNIETTKTGLFYLDTGVVPSFLLK